MQVKSVSDHSVIHERTDSFNPIGVRMRLENTLGNDTVSQPAATTALGSKNRRRPSRIRKIPSIYHCGFFLIFCMTLGESFEWLLLHDIKHQLPYGWLIFTDVFFMIVVFAPAFYYSVYWPMKQHGLERVASENEIKYLSRQLILSGDREKKGVARDLHDQFGQSLAVLQYSMESLKSSFGDKRTEQKVQCENLIDSIAQLGDMVRNISTRLSPPQLDNLGIIPTLKWAMKDFQNRDSGISLNLDIQNMDERLSANIELAIYRIFQESINNIIKHSEASEVNIYLSGSSSKVSLLIQDNGIGFDHTEYVGTNRRHRGIGLLGMRERTEDLEGEFSICSTLGKGTRIQVSIPRSLRRRNDK